MKWLRSSLRRNIRTIAYLTIGLLFVLFLYIYKLGSLVGGLNVREIAAATQAVGFGGIISDPLYLPLKIARSVVFALSPDHGQTLTRVPNVLLGLVAIGAFTWLVKLWHGRRTAIIGGLLFATSAWTLHVSRIATFDVVYLAAIPMLLLGYASLKKYPQLPTVHLLVLFISGVLLYVPGLIWIIIPTLFFERTLLKRSWGVCKNWRLRTIYVVLIVGLVLPLIIRLATKTELLRPWLGIPSEFAAPMELVKQVFAVPVHLFVRGPQYPELWLGKMPILDIFMLTLAVIGIYFYGRHLTTSRARLLLTYAIIGAILIAIAGPVSLSLLVPLAFLMACMGVTYLLHEWLKVFPSNPLPRILGIGLVCLAVTLSCTLNVRAYFVAWPHHETTAPAFQYHR